MRYATIYGLSVYQVW